MRLRAPVVELHTGRYAHSEGEVKHLLAHGADPLATDGHGGTVLHALAQFGFGARASDAAVVAWDALLVAGADVDAVNAVGETPLLLLLGASFEPGTACREAGWIALHRWCANNSSAKACADTRQCASKAPSSAGHAAARAARFFD